MMENHSHISKDEKEELKRILNEKLKNDVEIGIILDYKNNPQFSHIAEHLLREICELNEKLKCNFYKIEDQKTKEIILKHNLVIDNNFFGPLIFYKHYPNIIHLGFPLGREFPVFLEEIEFISSKKISISQNIVRYITTIEKEIDILVFVTSTCPYCPIMSLQSHKFAFINKKIRGIVIEVEQFPSLADKYDVFAVPKTIIIQNQEIKEEFEGAIPESEFVETILKVIEY